MASTILKTSICTRPDINIGPVSTETDDLYKEIIPLSKELMAAMAGSFLGLLACMLVPMAMPFPVELVDMSRGVLEFAGEVAMVTASTSAHLHHLIDHVAARSGLPGWLQPAVPGSPPGCPAAVLRLDCSGPRHPGILFSINVQHRHCHGNRGMSPLVSELFNNNK